MQLSYVTFKDRPHILGAGYSGMQAGGPVCSAMRACEFGVVLTPKDETQPEELVPWSHVESAKILPEKAKAERKSA